MIRQALRRVLTHVRQIRSSIRRKCGVGLWMTSRAVFAAVRLVRRAVRYRNAVARAKESRVDRTTQTVWARGDWFWNGTIGQHDRQCVRCFHRESQGRPLGARQDPRDPALQFGPEPLNNGAEVLLCRGSPQGSRHEHLPWGFTLDDLPDSAGGRCGNCRHWGTDFRHAQLRHVSDTGGFAPRTEWDRCMSQTAMVTWGISRVECSAPPEVLDLPDLLQVWRTPAQTAAEGDISTAGGRAVVYPPGWPPEQWARECEKFHWTGGDLRQGQLVGRARGSNSQMSALPYARQWGEKLCEVLLDRLTLRASRYRDVEPEEVPNHLKVWGRCAERMCSPCLAAVEGSARAWAGQQIP